MTGGDFNIIRYSSERNKPSGRHTHSDTFNTLIHFYELREITMSRGLYTWSDNQENPTLEIKDALFRMEKHKAAGLDKIPIEFYQAYWDIIKDDII